MPTCSHTQSTITEHLDTTREYLEQMKREQRVKEREAVKRVGDSLKSLCEGGGTLGEIQQRKEEFAKELKQTREEFQVWYCSYLSVSVCARVNFTKTRYMFVCQDVVSRT